ncbi:Exocyst complex component 5 like protein [Argiope bruennichi]|uniref:Exocyst complex component 5 like protein n=1 Tax=Argiope bruennichi TaxID=94029 RepID=A0A8T0E442_ARGBR|nr:Exocyst complex component 5 like protein [Argiope bruennichi]
MISLSNKKVLPKTKILISQILPKFEKARQRIAKKYDEIERELIDEFVKCHQADNRSKMKEVAGILSNFKTHIEAELTDCGDPERYLEKFERLYSSIHDLRRDIQARIGSRTNIIGSVVDNYGGETFLSEEIAMNILQDCKKAFNRCQLLTKQPSELPGNAVLLFDVLLRYLFEEHVSYALELGLLAIPLSEPKSPPEIYFFDVIRQCNAIYHLFEKQFGDTIVPLVICITSILGWVKFLLQTEQKKTDFKPESEMATFDADKSTAACLDRTVLMNFVQLRADYKTAKIVNQFR